MLIELVYASARARPDQTAIVHGARRTSYAELVERVERLAHGLAGRGIRTGDPVALLMANTPAFVECFFAIAGLGAVVVPLNPQFKRDELEFCFRSCRVRAAIADAQSTAVCERIAADWDYPIQVLTTAPDRFDAVSPEALIESNGPLRLQSLAPAEDVMQQFSSGSTGRPKRLSRTHGQLCAEARAYTWIRPDDRIFCAVPLFHTYGLGCCMLAAVRNAATLVFMEDPNPFVLTRNRALELLERERATVFPGVPFHFRLLAEADRDADLSSLRLCFSAGTALERPAFDAFRARFGIAVRQLYGCTEGGTLTANLDPDPVATFASVGAPLGDVRVTVMEEEIIVSSPALTAGYAEMEGLNRQAFRDGWFFTGDLGHLDGNGRLYITGRRKRLIPVAGHKVDPIEVEDVVVSHPHVRDAVVVGVHSSMAGDEEAVKAVVVAIDGLTERDLIRYCQERLAAYKVPQIVERREEIPKSPLGKVLRKYLL
ncbi:MAG TPA: AMP-binding protein [Solirubrobacteraceae bacterium]|nr:AMP-binding protein [Solirubrobacteraceae bacterium]